MSTDAATEYIVSDRPTWRGRMHAWAFVAGIPAGVWLILHADAAAPRAAATVYVATLLLVFGTSAAYHRLAHTPRARAIMQRLDHSMIYLLIAGTYVPFCLVAVPPAWGIPVMSVVAVGAIVGMVIKLALFDRRRAHMIGGALYPILGWAAIVAAPVLASELTPLQLGLMLGGGLAYTIGFPVLMLRRPDPWPRRFGYHEVWHTFTVVAAALHFAAVASIVA